MRFGRTAFVLTVALGILLAPLASQAEQRARVPRVGILTWSSPPPPSVASPPSAVLKALHDLGYVEGQTIAIERRYAEGKLDRLPELAAELVRLKVDLIVTFSFPAALAAKQATQAIPIVTSATGDPVGTGLVASLARPGGNITGVSAQEAELSGKRLELLKEAVPTLSRVALLWNTTDLGMSLRSRETQSAARALGVALQLLGVRDPNDFDQAFSAMMRERPDALFVVADPLTALNRRRILEFAEKHRLPAMYEFSAYVRDGGLMSYGPSLADTSQRLAYYVDRILKGAKPGDLPIEQPTKFELVINCASRES